MAKVNLVNIGSGNGVVPVRTMSHTNAELSQSTEPLESI